MGLLSSIGKAVKRVFRGVKKVFRSATDFAGRALRSKWGKALIVAATVYTLGARNGAWQKGDGSADSAGGFFSKFVTGGKNILQAFTGGLSGNASGGGAAAPAEGGTAPTEATPAPANGGATPGLPTVQNSNPQQQPGMLQRAAAAAGRFLSTPEGMNMAGNVITGYAQGKQQEALLEEEERVRRYYDNAWRDPSLTGQLMEQVNQGINTPEGLMSRARRVDRFLDERAPYPTQPGNPDSVYGSYVRG